MTTAALFFAGWCAGVLTVALVATFAVRMIRGR